VSEHRRVVVVGIPGVGKSTVVERIIALRLQKGRQTIVANYGSVMMEEASKNFNVKSRDEMRKLPIESQKKLQLGAAAKIKSLPDEFVIVDTHLFISTKEGYWPGMPLEVLEELKPTNLVLVMTDAETILSRRTKDSSRSRDPSTIESVERELQAAVSLLFASSLFSGCPALMITNETGRADEAALRIISAIESS
jgi:adenylate kinase